MLICRHLLNVSGLLLWKHVHWMSLHVDIAALKGLAPVWKTLQPADMLECFSLYAFWGLVERVYIEAFVICWTVSGLIPGKHCRAVSETKWQELNWPQTRDEESRAKELRKCCPSLMEHTSALDLWLCAFINKINFVKYNYNHQASSCYVTEGGQAFTASRQGSFRDVHSSSAANIPKVQRTAYPSLAPFLSLFVFLLSFLLLNSIHSRI